MTRPVLVGLVALFLVVTSVGSVVGTAAADPAGDRQAAVQTQDFDRSTFEITVHEDGSATWIFRHERTLANQSEEDDFEAYAEDFESEETELYERFRMQADSLVSTGENETGREMEATDFDRTAYVQRGINDPDGVVEMSFTWEGFAAVDDDGTVTVSDVFAGRLPLLETQQLTIRSGDGIEFDTVRPEESATESANRYTWSGEMEFAPGQPYVVFVPEDAENSSTAEGGDFLAAVGVPSWLALFVGVIVVAGISALAWTRVRSEDDPAGGGPSTPRDDGADGPGADAIDAPAPPDATDAPEPPVDDGHDVPPEAPGDGSAALTDAELMTDEDRVVGLIERNGGRMKQVDIVDETGWSKSKVSMLLSDMEEEGTISKLRVGRENIISLDGFEPEATRSPFDE